MGNLSKFVESRKVGFSQSTILNPTSNSAITPFSNLELKTFRAYPNIQSAGILPDSLCEEIEQKQPVLLKQIRRSMGALRKLIQLDRAETDLHITHREYQSQLAEGEALRKQADVDLGSKLIKLQSKYATMAQKLNFATSTTEAKISKSQQQYQQKFEEYLAKLQGDGK
jgi:hypothetical protein